MIDQATMQRLADEAAAFEQEYDAHLEAAYAFEDRHAACAGVRPRFRLVPTEVGVWGVERLDGGPPGQLP